ncbi:MAG TPA: TlpA disulfide reductase family protein [Pyrinomonadaceae bacterium]|nr:TlpA disulfide reductase family protein [Pyrinomonadaceae bacterium]
MKVRLAILIVCLTVAVSLVGFAARAQTPAVSAAKQDHSLFPICEKVPFGPRPRGCFCDEDCFAAMLERERARQKSQPIFKWKPALPKFKWQPLLAKSENEIRVIDLDGLKKILQRDPKDTRPLLINFWATWCDPCREEFPDLVKIDSDYRSKGLNFVAVSLDDITDIKTAVPKFLTEMKATMPVVLLNVNDPEPAIKAVDAAWDGQLPATFLYDKDGKVIFRHFGKIKPDELRAVLDKAIAGKQ